MLKPVCQALLLTTLFASRLVFAYDCAKEAGSQFFAAYTGNVEVLKKHKQNKCKFKNDERGLTLHDLASLSGESKALAWLKESKLETKPSKALIRLVQAGLNQLGYNAGAVDGVISKQTENAILAYQKQNKLKADKALKGAWLAHFHRHLLSRSQSALIQKGYKLGKANGVLNVETRKALIAYRGKAKISPAQYAYLDDAVIRSLLIGKTTGSDKLKTSKALAEQKAKEKVKEKGKATTTPAKAAAKPASKTTAHHEERDVIGEIVEQFETVESLTHENTTTDPNPHGIRLIKDAPAAPKVMAKEPIASAKNEESQIINGSYRTIKGKLSFGANGCQVGKQTINDHSLCDSQRDRAGKTCSVVVDNKGRAYNLLCK